MEIKERKGYYLLKNSSASVAVVFKSGAKVKDEINILVNAEADETLTNKDNVYVINHPGEYEIKDVFVMVIEKNGQNSYLIELDDVNIFFSGHDTALTEQDLDTIGTVDILCFKDGYEINSDVVKNVNRIDPKILLLQAQSTNKEDIRKFFGVELKEEAKKLKYTNSDFELDEYKLEIIQIGEE